MKRNLASLVALFGIVFVIPAAVEGQSSRQLLIQRVVVDFVSDEILVFGVNFTAGKDDPSATLGGQAVDVLGFEDTAITLRLPPETAPGDYFLTISTGSGSVKNDVFDFTIGAVGPQGDVGPQGPIGPQGPEGQPGPTPSFFGQSCPDGESVIGFDETGNLICNVVPPPPPPPLVITVVGDFCTTCGFPAGPELTIDGDLDTQWHGVNDIPLGGVNVLAYNFLPKTEIQAVDLFFINGLDIWIAGELEVQWSDDTTDGFDGTWVTLASRPGDTPNNPKPVHIPFAPVEIEWLRLRMVYQGQGARGVTPAFGMHEIEFQLTDP